MERDMCRRCRAAGSTQTCARPAQAAGLLRTSRRTKGPRLRPARRRTPKEQIKEHPRTPARIRRRTKRERRDSNPHCKPHRDQAVNGTARWRDCLAATWRHCLHWSGRVDRGRGWRCSPRGCGKSGTNLTATLPSDWSGSVAVVAGLGRGWPSSHTQVRERREQQQREVRGDIDPSAMDAADHDLTRYAGG
jgi:hypothetical protein